MSIWFITVYSRQILSFKLGLASSHSVFHCKFFRQFYMFQFVVLQLKEVRALFLAGAPDYSDFAAQLVTLEQPFQLSVRDLRSQVVREACITIA